MWPNIIKQVLDNFKFEINPELTPEQNAEEVTRAAALLSAAVAAEPIPFADVLLITPLQMKMVAHIGLIYGFKLERSRIKDIVTELGVTFAYGFVARQVMRGVAKIVAPVLGGIVTAPAIYGWTFALGKLAEQYFKAQLAGGDLGKLEAKRVARKALEQARQSGPSVRALSEFAESLRHRAQKLETDPAAPPPPTTPTAPGTPPVFEGEVIAPTDRSSKLN